eukprot:CAMPEP_0173080064 /NCGR_PEP_ID=MMETSP1102-20130122/15792_1 /TAXON_ID=49646 /ORGANISM="Geminigera sp., Strain Caron Lab Isolate" /LENGTH=476 /DNA_ID=CAMNT_0013953057 /DNA_START=330 /DNA_END=1761 /DNA_ORIENTATION=-
MPRYESCAIFFDMFASLCTSAEAVLPERKLLTQLLPCVCITPAELLRGIPHAARLEAYPSGFDEETEERLLFKGSGVPPKSLGVLFPLGVPPSLNFLTQMLAPFEPVDPSDPARCIVPAELVRRIPPGAERGSYPSGFGDEAEEHLLSIRDNRLANSLGIPLPLGGVPFPLGVPTPLNFLPCILECGAVVIRDGLSPRNSLGVPLPLGGVPPPLDVLGLLLECGAVVPLEGVLPLLELLPLSSAHTQVVDRESYPFGFGEEVEERLLSIRDNLLPNSLGVPFPLGVPTPLNFLPCILECGAVVIRDGLSPRNSLGVPLPLGGVPPPLDVLGLLLECGAVVPLEGVLPLLELLPLSSAHTQVVDRESYPFGFGEEVEERLLSIRDNLLPNSLGVPFPLGVPTPLNFLPCILECGAVVIRDGLSPRNSLGVPLPLGGVPPPLDVLGLLLECGAVVPLEGVLPLLGLLPLSSAHIPISE